ncbi:transposase, MuDR, MULE transposase domain protein [Tanacetum coccineum]|uniref:Transposase, MuDR, MULE transposase domain protein n=1 Tax=Tanacetum coccineum TaxID=301880 RepID=A0ABQ4Y3L1_9ASTR
MNHLRPLLIVDGGHLKGLCKGTNLIIVGDNQDLVFISDRHPAISLAIYNEYPLVFQVNMKYDITYWAADKVQKRQIKSAAWVVLGVNQTLFQVDDGRYNYEVNLMNGSCECRKWKLSGIPCGHVIVVIRSQELYIVVDAIKQDMNVGNA